MKGNNNDDNEITTLKDLEHGTGVVSPSPNHSTCAGGLTSQSMYSQLSIAPTAFSIEAIFLSLVLSIHTSLPTN